jgi:transcriptional regulator with XRE-family HTH domain
MESRIAECLAAHNDTLPVGEDLLTQAQIALEMGVTQGAVSLWMSGDRVPKGEHLFKLAALLRCEVGDLFATPDDLQAVNQESGA